MMEARQERVTLTGGICWNLAPWTDEQGGDTSAPSQTPKRGVACD